MRAALTLLTVGLLAITTGAQQVPATALRSGDIVLAGGQRFDTAKEAMVPNTGIIVRSGILIEVDAALSGRDLSAAQVIRLADDQFVLPGLFDLHAHYAIDLFGAGRVDEYTVNPIVFLANGVTSTFPAGEVDPEGMYEARRRIERGEQVGARIHSSGPYFGTARPGWNGAAQTPAVVRAEVDTWAARGVRGFKAKGILARQLLALIDQAHRYGLPVTAHLDSGFRNSVNPREAIAMGIDRIEHFLGGDAITDTRPAYSSLEALDVTRPEVDAIIDLYLKHNVSYNATLTAYGYWYDPKDTRVFTPWMDEMSFLTPHARAVAQARLPRRPLAQFRRIYETKFKEVKRFYDRGGGRLITLGTDHPSWGEFLSGFGTHRELQALVLAGIPPAAALKIATINGARALRMSDELGSLEPGKLADLIVIRGNPLTDITNTRRVEQVMVAGVLRQTAALFESVKGKMGPAAEADDAWWKGNTRLR
jgi:imidazolonepropionase-like amidohydrolase